MEELDEIKKELQKLIGRDKISVAIRKIEELPEEVLQGRASEVLLIKRNFNSTKKKGRMGSLRPDDFNYEMSVIAQNLLDLVSELGEAPIIEEKEDEGPINTTILFLASNPTDTGKLRLDKEIREIDEGLRRSSHRDYFKLEQRHAVRPADLSRAMLDFEPRIIHFSGHGVVLDAPRPDSDNTRSVGRKKPKKEAADYSGGIVLEDAQGNMQVVSAQALGGLFELFGDKITCVVLNACYSDAQANEIIKHVPYVIGMNTAIPDDTAIAFATGFYDAIGDGKDIEFAFKFAKNRIMLEGLSGSDIPQIRTKKN